MSFNNLHSATRGEPSLQPKWFSVTDVPDDAVGYFWSSAITMFSDLTSVIADRTDIYTAPVGDSMMVKHRGEIHIQVYGGSMTDVLPESLRPSYRLPAHLPVARISLRDTQ